MRLLAAALALAALPAYAGLAQEEDERQVTVEIKEIPGALRPDGRLVVKGTLHNTGGEPVRDLQLRLYVGSRVATRFELAAIADDEDRGPAGSATRVPQPFGGAAGEIGPGASLDFTVDLPAEDVEGLGRNPGVHPLRLEVRSRRTVGVADTFLPWWPSGRARSRIAWVWPLAQADDRDVDGIYADDSLADSVRPGGRLHELVQVADLAASKIPVTWAVDPALVSAVADMADGYRVRGSAEPVPGQGGDAAKRWLDAADAALSKRQSPVLALPYADPDVVALVRAGRADRVGIMLREGRQVLEQRLGVQADPTLAWPPGGFADSATLDVLEGDGVRTVLLDDGTFSPPEDPLNYTPTAPLGLDVAGGATALVTDPTIEAILRKIGDGGGRLDVQRFLAETALITLEQPGRMRAIVAAPPRDWRPLRAHASQLLEQSATVPWLEPTTVPAIAAPDEPRADVSRFLSYPAEELAAELPRTYLDRVFAERERLARFRSILGRDTTHTLPVLGSETLDRAVSASRRGDLARANRLVDSVTRRLDGEFGGIRIITGGVVTLTGETGRIPVTIENTLGEPVLLRVTIDTRGRLLLDQDRPVEQTFAEGKTQLTIAGRAVQAGEFTIAVRLLTPDGDPLPGGTATLRVRSTAYGRVALVITVGAFGVLLVASATRLVRRRRVAAAGAA